MDVRQGTDDLPAAIHQTLTLLSPQASLLNEIVNTGGKLAFFVGWFSDKSSRDILDWQLLRELSDLKISLDLDVYGPDEGHDE